MRASVATKLKGFSSSSSVDKESIRSFSSLSESEDLLLTDSLSVFSSLGLGSVKVFYIS